MIFESYRGMFGTANWDRVSVSMVEVDGVWMEFFGEHRSMGGFHPGLDVESYEDYLRAKNGKRRF